MTAPKFVCALKFADAWPATPAEIDTLLGKMTESLVSHGVEGLTLSGNIVGGSLDVAFDRPFVADGDDDDSLLGLALVVKALNSGRVSAPGWPDDEVVEGAMASVTVREFSLV